MIRWEKGTSIITWADEEQGSAIFCSEGIEESRDLCYDALIRVWVIKTPTRAEQWGLIKDNFLQVWNALETAFGMPILAE
jgi:hypothetical protein